MAQLLRASKYTILYHDIYIDALNNYDEPLCFKYKAAQTSIQPFNDYSLHNGDKTSKYTRDLTAYLVYQDLSLHRPS